MGNSGLLGRVGLMCIIGAMALVLLAADWAATRRSVALRAGCPAVLLGTSDALDDYPDMVAWRGRSYLRAGQGPEGADSVLALRHRARLERQVAAVQCSLSDPSSTNGHRVAPGPWPDGTATGLPRGTALFALHGFDPWCVLAAKRQAEVITYIADDVNRNNKQRC